ncbi:MULTISPECIES: hypothetical protein [unclassified Pseudomonas]|uniref:hypothetical protein n=1 Tax=unclassified Pseudomonas TaxID=196821 RepID=UPI00244A47ED|nr:MULTISPECIES: hypothetical protein [unclassified Pseudomonas]MDH0301855.1 hypothetical protein [Pseudomonas sp. GD04091]MDH1983857.1 hypothetical protein [Pseudomonas sp. GD03689]
MGTLVAKKYPTKLFLKAADHTYVECGTGGKAWKCWGGNTGGTAFNHNSGSTHRADLIACPDQRAGITRYLIDGVCHQAANRILVPANILVSGARGYTLSSFIYGTYGRSVFERHTDAKGDIADCMARQALSVAPSAAGAERSPREGKALSTEKALVRTSKTLYSRMQNRITSAQDALAFNMKAFERQLDNMPLSNLSASSRQGLTDAKFNVETTLFTLDHERRLQNVDPTQMVERVNQMTLTFQDEAANALTARQYEQLFGVPVDERLILADPDIVSLAFGAEVSRAVYGNLPDR